jgi:hypothetical protein
MIIHLILAFSPFLGPHYLCILATADNVTTPPRLLSPTARFELGVTFVRFKVAR